MRSMPFDPVPSFTKSLNPSFLPHSTFFFLPPQVADSSLPFASNSQPSGRPRTVSFPPLSPKSSPVSTHCCRSLSVVNDFPLQACASLLSTPTGVVTVVEAASCLQLLLTVSCSFLAGRFDLVS